MPEEGRSDQAAMRAERKGVQSARLSLSEPPAMPERKQYDDGVECSHPQACPASSGWGH